MSETQTAQEDPKPTLDELIVEGSSDIQEGLETLKDSRTAIHDAQTELVAAQAQATAATTAEDAAESALASMIDLQIENLTALKESLAL